MKLSMAIFPWKEDYSIQIEKIDEQHKKLVSYVNQLYEAMMNGNSHAVIAEILDGLVVYTVQHFRTEEQLMISHGYSDYLLHKKQHKELMDEVKFFIEKYNKGEVKLSIELADFLKKWLINHIASSDKIMGNYLKDKITQ
jgi:hemerythrin